MSYSSSSSSSSSGYSSSESGASLPCVCRDSSLALSEPQDFLSSSSFVVLEDDDDDDDEEEEDNDGECLELEEDEEEEDLVESSDSLERDGSLAERRGSVELLLLLLPLLVVVIFLDSKDCAWDIKKKKIQECLYFYFFFLFSCFPHSLPETCPCLWRKVSCAWAQSWESGYRPDNRSPFSAVLQASPGAFARACWGR